MEVFVLSWGPSKSGMTTEIYWKLYGDLGEPPWLKKPPNMNQLRSNQNGNMTINNLAIYDITSNNDIMKYMDT